MTNSAKHIADRLHHYAQNSDLLLRLSDQPLTVLEFRSDDDRSPVHRFRIIINSAAVLLVYLIDTEASELLGFLPDLILDDLYRSEPDVYQHFITDPVLDLAHAYDPNHEDFDLEPDLEDPEADLASFKADADSFYQLAEHLKNRDFYSAWTHYDSLDTTIRETVAENSLTLRTLRYYR